MRIIIYFEDNKQKFSVTNHKLVLRWNANLPYTTDPNAAFVPAIPLVMDGKIFNSV